MTEKYQELAAAVSAYQHAQNMANRWLAKAAEIDKEILALSDQVAQQRTETEPAPAEETVP